jgi:hypothetical protein
MNKKLLIPLLFFAAPLAAQDEFDFFAFENNIKETAQAINAAETDSARKASSEFLFAQLQQVLQQPGSFNYNFDTLRSRTVSIITPPDRKFHIYTFNTVLLNGDFIHYGILHYKDKKEFEVIPLKDTMRALPKGVQNGPLFPDEWYGALYYQIHEIKHWCRPTKYILLGFDGANITINRKVIDVLTFTKEGPIFGSEIFREGDFDPDYEFRVVMEANGEVFQTLRFLETGKTGNIILDRLQPSYPEVAGDVRYNIPSGEYDIYKLNRKGRYKKVEAKNYDFGQGDGKIKPVFARPEDAE